MTESTRTSRKESTRTSRNWLRLDRKALRMDINDSEWPHLAPTVAFVPDFLVTAWAEICNGHDDDALYVWSEMRGGHRGSYDNATD
jgi:hypothetical protein